MRELQNISTLPEGYAGANSTAELAVDPKGRFLYVSNRGHNSIAVYAIDPRSGMLRLVEHQPTLGKTPRGFGIDPGGRFLLAANQESDTIVVFSIDQRSGRLVQNGQSVEVGTPVCVMFLPTAVDSSRTSSPLRRQDAKPHKDG